MLIDFHSHILPNADHGCDDAKTALKQLRMASKAGVDLLVATPHYTPYLESVKDFLSRREASIKTLRQLDLYGLPQVLMGAEVLLSQGLDKMPDIQRLCIENSRCLLIEMPMGIWDEELIRTLENLKANKTLQVVIAHVDRYPQTELEKIIEGDLFMQLNASAFVCYKLSKKMIRLMNNPNTVALGSDIHGVKVGYKQYRKAVKMMKDRTNTIMDRSKRLLNID